MPVGRRIEDGGDHRRGPAEQRHAVALDPGEDLLAVDLAQHDVGAAHPGHRVGHAPPVAVEHGQRVQEDVAIADAGVPPEGHRVEPAVALRQLHAFGAGGGARGVVDRAGRLLVGRPLLRLGSVGGRGHQVGVVAPVEREAVLDVDPATTSLSSGS